MIQLGRSNDSESFNEIFGNEWIDAYVMRCESETFFYYFFFRWEKKVFNFDLIFSVVLFRFRLLFKMLIHTRKKTKEWKKRRKNHANGFRCINLIVIFCSYLFRRYFHFIKDNCPKNSTVIVDDDRFSWICIVTNWCDSHF